MKYNNEPCEKLIIYFRNPDCAKYKNCYLSIDKNFLQVYDSETKFFNIYPVETIDSIHFIKCEKERQEEKHEI